MEIRWKFGENWMKTKNIWETQVSCLAGALNISQKSKSREVCLNLFYEIPFLAGNPQRPLCGSGAPGAERRRRNRQQHNKPPTTQLRLLKQLLSPSSSSASPLLLFIGNRDNVGDDVDDDLGHRDDDEHAQLGKGD